MYTYKCINAWVSVGCTTVKGTSYCNTYVGDTSVERLVYKIHLQNHKVNHYRYLL